MNYLLPAQTFLDLCDQHANPARIWAADIDTAWLRISVVSVAEAQAAANAVPDSQARLRLEAGQPSAVCPDCPTVRQASNLRVGVVVMLGTEPIPSGR